MTIEQQQKLEIYKKEFQENCSSNFQYGSDRVCNFHVYESQNEEDKNITIVMSTIADISDDYQPFVVTNNIMIEPDGNAFNMNDVFPRSQVAKYVSTLKKID